jgi:hypothetical protein
MEGERRVGGFASSRPVPDLRHKSTKFETVGAAKEPAPAAIAPPFIGTPLTEPLFRNPEFRK